FPPNKRQNMLFAEALSLRLNIAASATGRFPEGLGELTYHDDDDEVNPFNDLMVSQISGIADSMLSCLEPSLLPANTSKGRLDSVLHAINNAFSDAIID